MSVAGPGLNGLIENLNQLWVNHSPLIADIKREIDILLVELKYLQSVMGDLPVDSTSRNDYLNFASKEIRGIVDEAEDAVDKYIVLASLQRSKGWVSSFLKHRELKDAGKQIANMSDKLSRISEKNVRTLQSQAATRSEMSFQVPKVEKDHVIGFKTPAEVVSKLLTEGPENLEVIVIAGVSGLGKTTLAEMVYKDPNVEGKYMIRAFVSISRQYDKKDVLLQILRSFSMIIDEELMNKNEKDLEEYVFQKLAGKPYLIVLDAVWETRDWDAFKGAFPSNEQQRCRVLITTTNVRLAGYANARDSNSLYTLDFLSPKDSEELLRLNIFGQNKFPNELEPYAHNIANMCSGLPLAIMLIARLLGGHCHDDRASWWKEVSESLCRNASTQGNRVIETVYEHLPYKLRPCFIYLGVFPQGYEIPVWKLVQLWISEGFINGREDDSLELEEIAELNLEELVQRKLVMVGRKRSNGKMKSCRLHNGLWEFCRKVGGEEKLFQVVNFNSSGQEDSDNCRRLCINGSIVVEKLSGLVSGKRVRSFLTFQNNLDGVDEKHVSVIQKAFKFLKVLEVHSLKLPNNFFLDLSRPVLLKYLAVSVSLEVPTIPSAFSGLWSLQTLIVYTNSKTLKVELDLWKLPHFRHFHTNSTAILPIPEKKRKKSVEFSSETSQKGSSETSQKRSPETGVRTLCTVSTQNCIQVLERTPGLKKLGVRGDSSTFFQKLGLRELHGLENLNLTSLTLMNVLLGDEDISTLGKMEKLEVLKLKQVAFQGDKWITEDGAFPNLVHLYIGSSGLNSWKLASPTQTETQVAAYFPKLKTLQLKGCAKLEALPAELVKIPSLQSVFLRFTNPELASSAMELKDKNNSLRLSVYPIY